MKIEDRLETWGWVFLIASIICAGILIRYAGVAANEYDVERWGRNGVIWGYVITGIAIVFQSLIVMQVLDGLAENIRLKRTALTPPEGAHYKKCPACDEDVRVAAKICRYCRCVLVKKDVKS